MSNAGRVLFTMMMVLVIVSYTISRSNIMVFDTQKDVYESAIRAASQVATKEIIETMDINAGYDGNLREDADVSIDLDALKLFRDTLDRLLDSKNDGNLVGITNINIPLTGFVTYNYIVGVTYKDTYLLPMGYTYMMEDTVTGIPSVINNTVWNFTLGDKIIINNREYKGEGSVITDILTKQTYDIGGFLAVNGFTKVEELADYVVMDTIDNYLNEYSGASFNPVANNTQVELEIELGKSKYSSGLSEYNTKSSVIDGPGMFAIVDVYKGSGDDMKLYQRVASFGGSELVKVN